MSHADEIEAAETPFETSKRLKTIRKPGPYGPFPKTDKPPDAEMKKGLEVHASSVTPTQWASEMRRAYSPAKGTGAANAVLHLCDIIDKQAEQIKVKEKIIRTLERYGGHDSACPMMRTSTYGDGEDGKCSCGWDVAEQALKGGE